MLVQMCSQRCKASLHSWTSGREKDYCSIITMVTGVSGKGFIVPNFHLSGTASLHWGKRLAIILIGNVWKGIRKAKILGNMALPYTFPYLSNKPWKYQ